MAEYLRVDFQEMARMSLYNKLALNIEKIFRIIQTADDVQPIGNDPLDEIMKSILRNAMPGIYNHRFRRWKYLVNMVCIFCSSTFLLTSPHRSLLCYRTYYNWYYFPIV